MRRRRPQIPRAKQPTPDELVASLLELVRAKFYQGHGLVFTKDLPRLRDWVILWPAEWLYEKAVTISMERYGEIMRKVIIEAAAHGNLGEIKYLPAWLKQTVQSHFRIHGEDIYDEAKAIRNLVDNALAISGKHTQAAPDPMKELTQAKRLLNASQPCLKPKHKAPVKEQLSLL